MVSSENRFRAFCTLGEQLATICRAAEEGRAEPEAERVLLQSERENPWFIRENQLQALSAICDWLIKEKLEQWLSKYEMKQPVNAQKVAVIMAGNIPMVNFHDFLAVLITGNSFIGKLSSQDRLWMPYIAELLTRIEPEMGPAIRFTDALLKDFDAVIATGSDNSSRYFEYYFGKYPHIIRRNRNSLAVLTGDETPEELSRLGKDIFNYFGLGCRNVSKLLLPEGYDIARFMEPIEPYKWVADHNKYRNNYDYRKAIYLVNSQPFYDNNFVLLREDPAIASPIGVIHTGAYKSQDEAVQYIQAQKDNLQCVVGRKLPGVEMVPFGESQQPGLSDYPDSVDIVQFLLQNRKES